MRQCAPLSISRDVRRRRLHKPKNQDTAGLIDSILSMLTELEIADRQQQRRRSSQSQSAPHRHSSSSASQRRSSDVSHYERRASWGQISTTASVPDSRRRLSELSHPEARQRQQHLRHGDGGDGLGELHKLQQQQQQQQRRKSSSSSRRHSTDSSSRRSSDSTNPYNDNNNQNVDLVDEYGMGIIPDDDDQYPQWEQEQNYVMNDEHNIYLMEEPTLTFWQLDTTDKFVCGVLFLLVVALTVILVLATS